MGSERPTLDSALGLSSCAADIVGYSSMIMSLNDWVLAPI